MPPEAGKPIRNDATVWPVKRSLNVNSVEELSSWTSLSCCTRNCMPNFKACPPRMRVSEPVWFQLLEMRRISLVDSFPMLWTPLKLSRGKAWNCCWAAREAGNPNDVRSNPSLRGMRLLRKREYDERNSPTRLGENRAVAPITAVCVRLDSLPPTVSRSVPLRKGSKPPSANDC